MGVAQSLPEVLFGALDGRLHSTIEVSMVRSVVVGEIVCNRLRRPQDRFGCVFRRALPLAQRSYGNAFVGLGQMLQAGRDQFPHRR